MKKLREWLFTAPSLFWLFLFFFIPTCFISILAFKPSDIYGSIDSGWTFYNLFRLFTLPSVTIVIRTLWVSLVVTFFTIALAIPVAYYLIQLNTRLRNLLLLAIIVPFWTSFLIRIFAWKALLHPEGILKNLVAMVGLIEPNGTLLYHTGTVIFMMIYTYLPFAILPIYAQASKFDFQLLEAAMDLGATRLRSFFRIFIPAIMGGILTAAGIVFIPTLGAYVIPDVVGGLQNEMIGNRIAQNVFVGRNIPTASAWSLMLILGILIPTVVILWMRRGGEVRNVE